MTGWLLGPRQADGEDRLHSAAIAFAHGHIVDADRSRRALVEDRSLALRIDDSGIGRIAQIDEECLVRLQSGCWH